MRALHAIERVHRAFSTWHTAEGSRDGGDVASEEPALEAGSRWGDLEILDRLGRGSFGDVYRARDPHLDRIVALKLIRRLPQRSERQPTDDGAREGRERRAIREGQLLARIRHENVVTVFGAAQHDGRIGLWMEYLEGKTLADLLREQGPFSAREAAGIGIDICRALAAVHTEGILHRDVKAQNVMRAARGRIVLTDFGIGRELGEAHEKHSLSGTPLYLAPEIIAGGVATVSSDLYAVGVLLYCLTTGSFPVQGASLGEIRRAHERSETRLLRDARPELPRGFVEVVEKALSLDPKERHASAGALERALASWTSHEEDARTGARVTSGKEPSKGWRSWKPEFAWVAGAGLVGVVVLFATFAMDPWVRARLSFAQALIEQKQGDTGKALRSLDRAVELDDQFAAAWMRRAEFLAGTGRYIEALASEDRTFALRGRLDPADLHAYLGLFHVHRMQYAEAVDEYSKATEINPQDDASWRELALAHANLGDYGAALDASREATRVDSESVVSAGLVPIFLVALGRSDEALETLKTAQAQIGDEEYFSWGEGLARAAKGECEAAQRAFSRLASSKDSGRATWGRLLLAQAQILTGQIVKAEETLEKGLGADLRGRNDRNEAGARIQLGKLALLKGERSEVLRSVRSLESVLVNVPLDLKSLRDTALLAIEAGDLDAARRLETRIRNIAGGYPSDLGRAFVAQVKGEFALHRGEAGPAREALEDAFRYRPDLSITQSLAEAWMAEGRYDRAEERLEEIVQAKGRALREYQAVLWMRSKLDLARCEAKLGRSDEARARYDEFLEDWGDAGIPWVAEARGERERLRG
ncbi:MAG TPA: protein kinase [Thermoanaerobaculia bacterium]|nr:protein kinase [Thermoanaerobaculia bacterium]